MLLKANLVKLKERKMTSSLEGIEKNRLIKAKEELRVNGFTMIGSILSEEQISDIKLAINECSMSKDCERYKDRNGLLRRMENFTFKNKVLEILNRQVRALLFNLTGHSQVLFKDKVNFKPPKGEGFFAHYDGVFQFMNSDGESKNGWYEYGNDFNNVLITLDDFNDKNGPLEIARKHIGNFDELLKNTACDGSPNLKNEVEVECDFIPLVCRAGSIIIFKHTCPHRSSANNSQKERGSLYLTYTPSDNEKIYEQYFVDKAGSKSKNKSLTGSLKNI
jgi:ectoine hydroxylase-related dioxygenase (phytanoyl-CoA dioxygenase family)